MRILSNLAIIFYSFVCLVFGFILTILAFNTIPLAKLEETMELIYIMPDVRIALGASGIAIILIGLIIAQLISGKLQREKTIAFDNPDGQVTVSLSAIEDLIKRVSRQIPEIKDLRPNVIASKKAINVVNRVVLFAGANIPEVTEKIQNVIKARMQEMLGIEEPIIIKVHVTKISSNEKQKEEKTPNPPTIFKGFEYSND